MLNDGELARRVDGQILLRPGGLRIRWDLRDLVTSDGHSARTIFTCTIKALDQQIERGMLEESFLATRASVTVDDVAMSFSPALRARLVESFRSQTIDAVFSESEKARLTDALTQAGKSAAFSSGLELLGPFELTLDCPTLTQQQTARRRATEQAEGLKRAGELFAQFQSIRTAAPELSAVAVLDRLGVSDQADLIKSILLASSSQGTTADLWVVSGNALVKITDGSPKIVSIPQTLGPMRSVQDDGEGNLLIGCRGGVMRLRPESPVDAKLYMAPAISSQLGFNSAIVHSDRIWATHGEAGVVAWGLDQLNEPAKLLRPQSAFAPGNLISLNASELLFASGGQLFHIGSDAELRTLGAPVGGNVVAIVVQDEQIISIHEDGLIFLRNQDGSIESQRRVARLSAAASTPWLGDQRLLLATDDGPILCAGVDDDLITQFTSPYRALRIIAGTAKTIAAVSSDRQRLILWNSWDGRKPSAEIHIASLTQHRIADIAFIPPTSPVP